MTYNQTFEYLWSMRPRRQGGNPKRKAFNALNARLKQGAKIEEIEAGLRRYVEFVTNTGKLGTEYVMQMATFFGPDERWLEDWAYTKPTETVKLPFRDEDLVTFAKQHNLSKPKQGEYYPEYRARLRAEIGGK